MIYIRLILKLVLVLSRFSRLLMVSFLQVVSDWLTNYWKRTREFYGSRSLHLRHDLKDIVGAAEEEFDPKLMEKSEGSVDLKGGNAVLENNPLQ